MFVRGWDKDVELAMRESANVRIQETANRPALLTFLNPFSTGDFNDFNKKRTSCKRIGRARQRISKAHLCHVWHTCAAINSSLVPRHSRMANHSSAGNAGMVDLGGEETRSQWRVQTRTRGTC